MKDHNVAVGHGYWANKIYGKVPGETFLEALQPHERKILPVPRHIVDEVLIIPKGSDFGVGLVFEVFIDVIVCASNKANNG